MFELMPVFWWNDQVEQLAANNLTIPEDAIASLLQRRVLPSKAYDHTILKSSSDAMHAITRKAPTTGLPVEPYHNYAA